MATFVQIITIIPPTVATIGSIIAAIASWNAKRKAKKEAEVAKTEAEKAKAEADIAAANLELEQAAKEFIAQAEKMYSSVDAILKAKGESAGALKKETVLAKLRTYAIEKGFNLDVVEWTDKIDELVKFTKSVNAKK